jgi:putative transcriptional regulator
LNLKHIVPHFTTPEKGNLLISEPFLSDYHFRRTVVLVGDHTPEGSVGFILNRVLALSSNEVVPDLLTLNFPLFYGGPVEPNTLHFIHKAGNKVEGSQEVADGIFWGGDIEQVNELLNLKEVTPEEFRFFIGYSGWTSGQLQDEIDNKAWWIARGGADIVFDDDLDNMWKNVVRNMGQDFAYMADSPEDPSWN